MSDMAKDGAFAIQRELGDVDALFLARTFYAGDMEFVKYP
jgi:hypothetical protein